ncbi:MAG: aldose 1-epimerase [Planctomycetia bacterium]
MNGVEETGVGPDRQIVLRDAAAGSQAVVRPHHGFNCTSFIVPFDGRPFDFLFAGDLFGQPGQEARHGTPILAPFPNRIAGGRFTWDGKDYALPCNERGGKNAIHGFVYTKPWRTVDLHCDDAGACVRGEFQLSVDAPDHVDHWPADFKLAVDYRLSGSTLEMLLAVENPDLKPLPFGVGTHPYFRFPLVDGTPLDEVEVVVAADQVVELVECLPTGRVTPAAGKQDLTAGVRMGDVTPDDLYRGIRPTTDARPMVKHRLRDHRQRMELEIEHDADFGYVIVFTPPHRQAVCIEPYTCATNAVNLQNAPFDAGLLTIPPGGRRRFRIAYNVRSF